MTFRRPTLDEWRAAVPGLKRKGRELQGACPVCGGTDRFAVSSGKLHAAVFNCRHCGTGADAMKAILAAAGFTNGKPLPPDPEREQREQAERERFVEEERRQAEAAAEKARWIVARCTQGPHPYLERKGFPEMTGLIARTGALVVPVWNAAGVIRSVEFIHEDGRKLFLRGSEIAGNFHRIGRAREVWLTEGYSTGLSVFEALRRRHLDAEVRVCFSASNLEKVGQEAIKRGLDVFAVADNDENGVGEKAAKTLGKPYWMPPTVGMDANDHAAAHGIEALADALRRFRYG